MRNEGGGLGHTTNNRKVAVIAAETAVVAAAAAAAAAAGAANNERLDERTRGGRGVLHTTINQKAEMTVVAVPAAANDDVGNNDVGDKDVIVDGRQRRH